MNRAAFLIHTRPGVNLYERTIEDMDNQVLRGELYYADLNPVVGSEQGGIRPVLILQNDVGNRFSPTTITACLTSKLLKTKLPTHCVINPKRFNMVESVVLLEQLRTLDKTRLQSKIGVLCEKEMKNIDVALAISVGLNKEKKGA